MSSKSFLVEVNYIDVADGSFHTTERDIWAENEHDAEVKAEQYVASELTDVDIHSSRALYTTADMEPTYSEKAEVYADHLREMAL